MLFLFEGGKTDSIFLSIGFVRLAIRSAFTSNVRFCLTLQPIYLLMVLLLEQDAHNSLFGHKIRLFLELLEKITTNSCNSSLGLRLESALHLEEYYNLSD